MDPFVDELGANARAGHELAIDLVAGVPVGGAVHGDEDQEPRSEMLEPDHRRCRLGAGTGRKTVGRDSTVVRVRARS